MKKYIIQITVSLLATAMVVVSTVAQAQDANTNASSSASQTMTSKPEKHKVIPFRGKVTAVDTKAMTLTVGKRTFQVTSDSKIVKDGQPATLSEGVVGDMVRGTYKKADDGKLVALSVNFGSQNGQKQKKPSSDSN